jgi:hypothetical protein
MRLIELEFKGTDVKAVAKLLDDDAPRTCNEVWKSLPLENEMVHSSWSGEALLAVPCGVKMGPDFPQENKTIFVAPGELAFDTSVEELLIFYGRGEPRWRKGPVPVSVFAKIVEGHEVFSAMCKKMPWEGAKVVIVRKKE